MNSPAHFLTDDGRLMVDLGSIIESYTERADATERIGRMIKDADTDIVVSNMRNTIEALQVTFDTLMTEELEN